MKRLFVAAAIVAVSLVSCANDGSMVVDEPWARPTPPTATNAAFYGIIRNETAAHDRITAMSSPQCEGVELHRSSMTDGVMSMRLADPWDSEVLGDHSLTLEPGALHIMCVGLQEPLVEGTEAELVLTFENFGTVSVDVPIKNR